MKATLLLALIPAIDVCAQERGFTRIGVERKQALVIGNSTYARAALKNPDNDATSMEATLKKLGFEVRTLRNLDRRSMATAIDEFAASLGSGSLAFFYFSGHGIQVNYANYLLPVDFSASSEADVEYEAYPASRVQSKLESSGARLRILVLDACRNNPFRYRRDAASGLAPMSVNAEGTLIAFATGDNNTADDNQSGVNGLYTQYLIPALLTPGLQLHEAFRKAKEEVYQASRRTQNPSVYENIVGRFSLLSSPVDPASSVNAASETWAMIKDSRAPEDFESFARAFPSSDFARAAEIRAAQLRRTSSGSTPPRDPASVEPPAGLGATRVNPKNGLTYAWIPPGEFQMGCSEAVKECKDNEKPRHLVKLTKGFWIGTTETTQEAYGRIVGLEKLPESVVIGPGLPVYQATWAESDAYCQAIGMRLPTEAEWEFAARGGSQVAAPLDSVAWIGEASDKGPHHVAQKNPNAFGLYDMLGNVAEWVADWYDANYYASSPAADPTGPPAGTRHIARGGYWGNTVAEVSLTVRYGGPRESRGPVGFRCAGE